jgi:hypothetical protein
VAAVRTTATLRRTLAALEDVADSARERIRVATTVATPGDALASVFAGRLMTWAMFGDEDERVIADLSVSAAWATVLASRVIAVCLIDVADDPLAAESGLLELLIAVARLGEATVRVLAAVFVSVASLPLAAERVMIARLIACAALAELAENDARRALIVAIVAAEAPAADNVLAVLLETSAILREAADRVTDTARDTTAELEVVATKDRTAPRSATALPTALLAAVNVRKTTRITATDPTLALDADLVELVARTTEAELGPPAVFVDDDLLASAATLGDAATSATSLAATA